MKFRIVSDEGAVKISNKIPDNCLFRKISHAEAEYTEGTFGAFSTQLLRTYSATIGWLNFDLNKEVQIRPETTKSMVAACYTLKGNIDCDLQGVGDVKLIDSNYTFYYIPPKSDNKAFFKRGKYDIVYISIKEKYTAPLIHKYPEFKELYERTFKNVKTGLVLPVPITIGADELNILREIQEHNLETPDLELFTELKVNELLLIHLQKLRVGIESNTPDPNKIAIEKIAKYIEQHLSESFTDDILSQMAMMNKNTFVEEFRKYNNNMSPSQYTVKIKMEHAAWLLKNTSHSIADITIILGYGSPNYFSTAFKTYHKCTPTDYRNYKSSPLIPQLTE